MFRLAAIFALIANTAAADPNFWKFEWPNTDFETTNVQSWVEILSGGPPKHGIPAIDGPSFVDVFDESRITDRELVITLELAGETPRAYPIRYLMWHEIVNDADRGGRADHGRRCDVHVDRGASLSAGHARHWTGPRCRDCACAGCGRQCLAHDVMFAFAYHAFWPDGAWMIGG
jgi:hypothetical protein